MTCVIRVVSYFSTSPPCFCNKRCNVSASGLVYPLINTTIPTKNKSDRTASFRLLLGVFCSTVSSPQAGASSTLLTSHTCSFTTVTSSGNVSIRTSQLRAQEVTSSSSSFDNTAVFIVVVGISFRCRFFVVLLLLLVVVVLTILILLECLSPTP